MHPLKDRKQSSEHINKRIESLLKNGKLKGQRRSIATEFKKGRVSPWKGKTGRYTQETIDKIKAARARQVITKESRIKAVSHFLNEKHWAWKGENVGYFALHSWVRRKLGTPQKCEHCGKTETGRYYWANKSHEYKRDLTDWLRLCGKCHAGYDNWGEKISKTKRATAKLRALALE